MEGGYWASATEPELPGEIMGGLEDIEKDREQLQEVFDPELTYSQLAYCVSHGLRTPGTNAGQCECQGE
jgi:hypothetical protein